MRIAQVLLATSMTILCAVVAAQQACAVGTDQSRAEGLKLYQAGHYEEALLCFDQVLARHGRDIEILIKRGACYLKLDKPEKALADFDRVNQRSQWGSRVFGRTRSSILTRRGCRCRFRTPRLPRAGETAASRCSCSSATTRRSKVSRRRCNSGNGRRIYSSMRAARPRIRVWARRTIGWETMKRRSGSTRAPSPSTPQTPMAIPVEATCSKPCGCPSGLCRITARRSG